MRASFLILIGPEVAAEGYTDERIAFGRAAAYVEANQGVLRPQQLSPGCVGW